jgi:hypothetical protein
MGFIASESACGRTRLLRCSGVPGRTDRAKQIGPVGDGATPTPDASPFADEGHGVSAYASKDRPQSKSERDAYAAIVRKAPPPASFEQRSSVSAAGYGGSQTTGGNPALGSNTATSSVYGTAVGADYHFSPFTMTGFALAGGGTNFSIANALGAVRSDLFQASLSAACGGTCYVMAAVSST